MFFRARTHSECRALNTLGKIHKRKRKQMYTHTHISDIVFVVCWHVNKWRKIHSKTTGTAYITHRFWQCEGGRTSDGYRPSSSSLFFALPRRAHHRNRNAQMKPLFLSLSLYSYSFVLLCVLLGFTCSWKLYPFIILHPACLYSTSRLCPGRRRWR